MKNLQSLHQFVEDTFLYDLTAYQDDRGYFIETYKKSWKQEIEDTMNLKISEFVFEACSFNKHKDIIRGMHAQNSASPQAKLITVMSGKILDVFIDARIGSSTFGNSHSVEISASQPKLLYLPEGVYHGFLTLEPDTTVFYKINQYYDPKSEVGLLWNNPNLNMQWPKQLNPVLSDKDKNHPTWKECYKFEGLK